MREIKFRAWDKVAKRWTQSGFWISTTTQQLEHIKELDVSQYTGLKDKKGKEIYEGDILDFGEWSDHSGRCVHEVLWDDRGAKFVTFEHREARGYGLDPFSEVIGNIYESPSLLDK